MITDPISTRLNASNATVIGRAALNAERVKNNKFLEDFSAANMLFLPFVFETYGRWGSSFGTFFYFANDSLLHIHRHRSWNLYQLLAGGDVCPLHFRNPSPRESLVGWPNLTPPLTMTRATGLQQLLIKA